MLHTDPDWKTRVASKGHSCYKCGLDIEVGEKYLRLEKPWTLLKQHIWDCSFQAANLPGVYLVHQRFSYIKVLNRLLFVQLSDQALLPRWHRFLLWVFRKRPHFLASPAWFVVNRGCLAGPFQDIEEGKKFLMS